MALDHPYAGLVSIHVDREGETSHGELVEWFESSAAPALFADGTDGPSPVDQVQHWRPIIPKGDQGKAPMKLGTGPGTRARSMLLAFTTVPPDRCWDRIRELTDRIDESGLATVRLAAPFIPTIPGTDTYTDQLW